MKVAFRDVLVVLALGILGGVFAVACGEDGDYAYSSPTAAPATATLAAAAVATSTPAPVVPTAATGPAATAAPTNTSAPPAPSPTSPPAGGGATINVTIAGFAYSPSTLTARAGQSVSIAVKNNDSVPHTFTITGLVNSGTIGGGASQTVTFTPASAGTLTFFCNIHGQATMSCTITVS